MPTRRKPTAKAEPQAKEKAALVLADNVAKAGKIYPAGTPIDDLPEALREHVLANPALCVEP